MKNIFSLAVVTLLFFTQASAQRMRADYRWADTITVTALTEEEQKEPAVYLKHYNFIEYIASYNGESPVSYHTVHRHVKINSDEAIQSFNKVYISMYNALNLVELEARTISPRGEVKVLEKSAVKDIKDENGYEYKIFALEGIEKGSEVEYVYTVRKTSTLFGREYFQSRIRARDCRFELASPSDLKFACKGYNGDVSMRDSMVAGKNVRLASVTNVPALKEEKYSDYNAHLMRVDYYLKSVQGPYGNNSIYTWEQLSQAANRNYFTVTGKEKRAVKKLVKTMKLDGMSPEQKIRAVETYLKNNIALKENKDVDNRLNVVLAQRYADEHGTLKLYATVFKQLGITVELVFTSDRSEAAFDETFPNYRQLSNTFLYFPGTNKYMAPTAYAFRYGILPSDWMNNYGIFVYGSINGNYDARFIEPLSCELSRYNHDITLKIDEEEDKVKMDVTCIMSGYYALNMHFVPLQNEKDKKDMLEGMITALISDAEIKKVELENKDMSISTADTAYKVMATLETGKLLSRAGNKLLLKIGESIGPQDEMYQEEERQNSVENTYNRVFRRTIKFTVPEGYAIKNPGDLNMNVVCKDEDNGKDLYGFVSTYKLEGNLLTVKIDEYYKQITLPRERFEDFRKVVNAAADFNKVILVLEKK